MSFSSWPKQAEFQELQVLILTKLTVHGTHMQPYSESAFSELLFAASYLLAITSHISHNAWKLSPQAGCKPANPWKGQV